MSLHYRTTKPMDSTTSSSSDSSSSSETSSVSLQPSEQTSMTVEHPRHQPALIYCVFYLLGMNTLLPWNFFITASSYWEYKFRNVSQPLGPKSHMAHTQMQHDFFAHLSVASMVPATVFLTLNTLLSTRINNEVKIVTSMLLVTVFFVATTALVPVDSDDWQEEFFQITIALVVLVNSSIAVFQGGLFGLAAQFPARYLSAVISGQALGAVFTCVVRILSIALATGGPEAVAVNSALVFFILADVTLAVTMLAFLWMTRTFFYRYYTSQNQPSTDAMLHEDISVKHVLFQVRWYALSVILVLAVTLALFPTVAATVRVVGSEKNPTTWSRHYFVPVFCFLWFNLGDYMGRTVGSCVKWPPPRAWPCVLLLVLARIGFFPLLMFCNVDHHHLRTVFDHDAYYITFMAAFGLSNGYLVTLCLMYGPSLVEPAERNIASAMMLTFLSVGLCIGAALSTLIVHLL